MQHNSCTQSVLRCLFILLAYTAISACSSNYVLDATFPKPLVKPLPVEVHLNITEDFSNYVYQQQREERTKLSVDMGKVQVKLFETVSSQLFSGSTNPKYQLTLTPSIQAFQYAIPRETRAEIYEIWLKYRILLTDSEGQSIADWLITGYGKTPTAFLKSQQEAINMAAEIALRDVGSQLSIGFYRQPNIQDWLKQYALAYN